MSAKPTKKRNLRQDLLWGLRRGVFFCALILSLGTIAFILQGLRGDWSETGLFLRFVAVYLAACSIIGIGAGYFREGIKTRAGAMIYGACVGAIAALIFLLYVHVKDKLGFNPIVDPFFTIMGVIGGTFLGWSFWNSSRRYGLIAKND